MVRISKHPTVESVVPDSPAYHTEIMPGDILLKINNHPIHDDIDLLFYSKEHDPLISIKRGESIFKKNLKKDMDEQIGVELRPFQIKKCKNRCDFCFIYQLPKGLRRTLYIKDDDYRMSFLYGNYITLTNLTPSDKKRIVEQRLSPLYISVHSTNTKIRNKLLRNKNAPDIMKKLLFFVKNKIKLHTQIVLCPGLNDGRELENTIKDLYKFYPYVSSIAVVPVGLTEYNKKNVAPVTKDDAEKALSIIEKCQKRFLKKHGEAFVYASDELYLKVGSQFPPIKDYGELPQIENGVGMIPQFLQKTKRIKRLSHVPGSPIITFTGYSFFPFLEKIAQRLNKKYDTRLGVIPVENLFFGKTVTVAGLLTGRDIIRTLIDKIDGNEILLIPDVVLDDSDCFFLDDIKVDFIGDALNIKISVIDSSIEGLYYALQEIE